MADIDNLQIKISADANKATNALNKLASSLTNFQRSLSIDTSKLTSISNSIQSIANSASSMNTSGIKNISTLTNSINRMGKIDTSGLSRISSALKTFSADMAGTKVDGVGDIASIASSISRLGGVASGRAITNIPLLAKNLKQLFTTLSTAPNVSENIIRMTNALAGLASTGAASGRAANSLGRNLNTYTTSAKRATKSTFSLAAAFGKFYATYFIVIRGIKSLWKSIEGTTDYIEAFNYYTVAFNKVGKEWGKDFEKFGYDNAEDYAQSFGNRVNELLGKMSGLKVDVDGGLISESGMKNLGLNLQEITQYASQLASITNSLGQTGEVTTAISKSMTMLAGDISSLFNVDFSTVANNLQSGLIGQSRALYKYGIDITNATLQTYAYRYGIEKAVSEMSQAEKQQLRLLAILDQSKVSWGDLANTINSPSNMIRQFTNNVKEAGMVLGQLFIPVLQKVLPVINGVVIAIKRLLVSVANLMGIKIDFSSFGQGVSGYNEDLEDTADALDKVGTSAKNAQSGIRAFDRLNVISTPKSSGSGSGAGGAGIDLTKEIMDATAEYEKVWQEAFDKMQNTAMGWADKVSKVFKPVKDIIEDLSYAFKFDSDSWFKVAGMDTSKLVTGIFDWFTRAIDSVDWEKIGRHIGSFLDGMDWTAIFTSAGNFIKTAIDAAIDLWKGSFDAAPIETTILTAIGLLKFTGLGDILWKVIKDSIVLSMGGKAGAGIGETILGNLLGTGAEGAASAGATGLFGGISAGAVAATVAITAVVAGLALVYATNEDVRKSFKESISAIADNLTPAMEFLTTTVIPDLQNAWTGLVDVLTPIGEFLKTAFTSIWQDMLNPALKYVGEEVLPKLQSAFENLWNGVLAPFGTFLENILKPAIQIVSDILTVLWKNVVVPLAQALGSVLGAAFDAIVDTMNFVVEQVKPVIEVFNFLWNNVLSPLVMHLWNDFKPQFETVFTFIKGLISSLKFVFSGLIEFISGIFTTNWKKSWEGIKDIFKGIWNGIVSIAEGALNLIIDGINFFMEGFSISTKYFTGMEIPDIPHITIPKFETGGYVPSRYTMFMAGENGVPEIAGTVGGKTAVAGGVEITGIKDAINATAQQEIALLKQNNQLLQGILEKEFGITTDQIGIAARQYGQEQFNQKHKNVYVF